MIQKNPLGANAWIWVSPPTDDAIRDLAPKVSAMGFDVLELPVENPADWNPERAAECLSENNLSATVCAAMSPGRELAGADDATIEETLRYVRRCVDVASVVGGEGAGGGIVAGPLFSSVGRAWRMDATEKKRFLSQLVESLAHLSEYAGERGVRLAVEPLNRFETSVLNTAEQTMEVVEAVDSPACGVLLDTFHMNIEEPDMPSAIRAVGNRLFHFHACANDRGAPGVDHIDWPGVARALREISYEGAIVIESFTSENDSIATAAAIWRPLAPTQDEIAAGGLAFLKGLFQEQTLGNSPHTRREEP